MIPLMRSCHRVGWLLIAAVVAAHVGVAVVSRLAPSGGGEGVFVHVKLADSAGGEFMAAASAGGAAVTSAAPLFRRPAEALAADQAQAAATLGEGAPDLGRWWRLEVAGSPAAAARLAAELGADARVATAFVAPRPELPLLRVDADDRSCPVRTPRYEPYQGYLAEAPAGINAPAAWALPGGRGEGIRFADVEGAWNARHEDLPGDRMSHAGGAPMRGAGWRAHGTAVVGVVAARDNELGMVGIVPDVDEVVTASIGRIGAAAAIDLAQARLRPGDVLLIELHAIGPRGRFLPMEYWDDVFEVVKVATSRGVVVVAAAGNGDEDLDHPRYEGKLDRRVRDSGAILVGAGAPARDGFVDRSRLWFSNYGSRVDVQGWGAGVATLDYGDLQDCDAVARKYTNAFGGTSSASPVVAGAAIALQGIHKARTGEVLAPRALRELLRQTGSPQTDGPYGPADDTIGPRPDLARAVRALEQKVAGGPGAEPGSP
jgi:subtilisin family serine protease